MSSFEIRGNCAILWLGNTENVLSMDSISKITELFEEILRSDMKSPAGRQTNRWTDRNRSSAREAQFIYCTWIVRKVVYEGQVSTVSPNRDLLTC